MLPKTAGSKSMETPPLEMSAGAVSESLICAYPPAGAVSLENCTVITLGLASPAANTAKISRQANLGTTTSILVANLTEALPRGLPTPLAAPAQTPRAIQSHLRPLTPRANSEHPSPPAHDPER
jgi:hypothetical protein